MRMKISVAGVEIGVFDDDEIDMNLAMQLEDQTGYTVVELLQQVGRGSARAIQALVWVTTRQAGKPAELNTNFKLGDLAIDDLDKSDAAEGESGKGDKAVKAVKAA